MALLAIDWNGTLIDDTAAWAEAYNAALGVLGIAGQELYVLQDKYDVPVEQSILNFGVSREEYDAKSGVLFTAFSETLRTTAVHAELRNGAAAFLDDVKAQGHHLYLLSSHHKDDLEREIGKHGLQGAFHRVSGRDDHGQIRTKSTKQQRLEDYIQSMGKAEPVFVIGDSTEDARLGALVGGQSVCITGGYSSKQRLLENGAFKVVDTLAQVKFVIHKHNI